MNYQTCGLMMDLSDGRFMQNGGCGYVLKPAVMCDEISYFRAGTRDVIPGISPQILHIKVCIAVIVDHYRATLCKARYMPSSCVCLSVWLSVTLWYCIKTAKNRITQIMPYDSPGTLVFWRQKSRRNSNGIAPCGGDKCRCGGLKLVIFDEKRAITRKRYKIDA